MLTNLNFNLKTILITLTVIFLSKLFGIIYNIIYNYLLSKNRKISNYKFILPTQKCLDNSLKGKVKSKVAYFIYDLKNHMNKCNNNNCFCLDSFSIVNI